MRLRLLVPLLATLALVFPTVAPAEDPPFVGWTKLLAGLGVVEDMTRTSDCAAGNVQCAERVIRVLTRHFEPLAESCHHDAVFVVAYLRTTQAVTRAVEDATFFGTPSFINREIAEFARLYFDAYDAWRRGDVAAVPGAWRIAFEAARNREMPAAGNLILGINAHIQRDLPFALYRLGLGDKADHDKVDEILNRIADDVVAEIARRFDPTVDDGDLPTTVDNMALFQVIPTWREIAWRHAELLASAATEAERAAVAERIEEYATSQALALKALNRYPPLVASSAERDAYCAAHHAG